MSNKTKFKIQRALGLELPGLGKEGALEKHNYPPGQHGQHKKKKLSEFGAQLREKQKLLFHYGIREEQLRRFVRQAHTKGNGNWIEELISHLSEGSTTWYSVWALLAAWPPRGNWSRTDMSC